MIIACPTCDKSTRFDSSNAFRPFCSERCKLIDLGEWASESRSIAGEPISPEELGAHIINQAKLSDD